MTLEEAPRELRIAGVVLDPNGRGVPQAHLWFYDDPRGGKRSGTADGEGRFDLVLRADRPHQLRAVDPQERFPECAQSGVAPGTTDVVLQFRPARWLAIVAQNQEGDLIPIETLYATNRAENNIIASGKESGEAEAGARLLEPAEPFIVKILAPGHEEGHFGPLQPGSLPERSEFRLEPLEGVRGLVRQAGRPVAGARVELYAAIGETLVLYSRGFRATRRSFPYQQTITDAEGRFQLTPREASDFFVRVEAENLAPAEQEVADYDPKRGENLVFDLTEGGVIHGVVYPPRGEEPNGRMVAASRGDGNEERVRTDEDGLFRFERVMPGRWFVEVLVDDVSSPGETLMGLGGESLEAPPFEWNVEVREGEESFVELDLGLSPRAVLAGELFLDGSPAEGWTVGLSPWSRPSGRPSEHRQATLDGQGRFQVETPILGGQTLTLNNGSHSGALTLYADLDLSDGVQEWRLELETGAVWVQNVSSTSDEFFRPHLSWTGENGVSARPSAELALRLAKIAELERQIAELDQKLRGAARDKQKLEARLKELLAKRRALADLVTPGQLALVFGEAPLPTPPCAKEAPDGETKEDKIRPRHVRKNAPREISYAALPREHVQHEIPEAERICPVTKKALVVVGEKTTEELEYRPGKLVVLVHHRALYGLCEAAREERTAEPLIAPAPARPIENALAGAALLAWILVQKYCNHLPL